MTIRKTILTAIIAVTSTLSMAQNAILINEYVKAGVNATTGTLGSGGNTNPGLQYDSTGTGTFNSAYDYLTPGSPFEGFTIKIDGISYRNNNAGNFRQITGTWNGATSASSAVWEGSVAGVFDLRNTYSLASGQQFIGIQTRITVTNAVSNLYFARYIDPDARAAAGDSSSTDNVRGYSGVPGTNVVFSEALSSRYALGIYTSQIGGVNTGPSNAWSTDPEVYYAGGSYTVGQGDHTMGISFYSSGLSAGDIVTYNYAYIFGPNAFAAATTAVTAYDSTATFTVTNVGSATSAASGPTVTGTSTATIVVSDSTTVNPALPVISGSVAHHTATEGAGLQTISRETTTTVTTPMRRDLVTKIRTTTNYSDGTSTSTDSAETTTTTFSNSVHSSLVNDSFSGRIDQLAVLNNLNYSINRSLNMNAFRGDGIKGEKATVFINSANSNTKAANGYSAKGQQYGLATAFEINKDLQVGLQYNRIQTTLNGSDSTTKQNKDHFGAFSVYNFNDSIIETNLGHSRNVIANNRNIIGIDFSNSLNTNSKDTWLSNRVYLPQTQGLTPFLGFTKGRTSIDGYTEAGSIQSMRTVGKSVNDYEYSELGMRYDKKVNEFDLSSELSNTSDNLKTVGVRVAYNVNKDSQIALAGTRQLFNNQATNTVTMLGTVRF